MYKTKKFQLYELLPKDYYYIHKHNPRAWLIFDPWALITLDALRDLYGKAYVNDWWWGGDNQYRGFRPEVCLDENGDSLGEMLSQHKYGRAFDEMFVKYYASEVRDQIRGMSYAERKRESLHHITAIEDKVDWFHFDVRNHNSKDILFF